MAMKPIFAALLLMTASCVGEGDLSDSEKDRVVAEVRTMLHRYHEDIRLNGLTAEFAYLDSSDDFFWVPPGYSSALSYDSVASAIRMNARLFQTIDNSWDSLRVIPQSGFLALFTGTISSRMTDTAGNATEVSLIESGVVVQRRDGWKLLSGQTALLPQAR